MKYSENEVLNIISSLTDKNPNEIILNWNINKSNTLLDLNKTEYKTFVFSFPLLVNNKEVATITIADLYNFHNHRDYLMQKYFGHEKYEETYFKFSHETYLDCYLTIHKDFELPKIVEGFYGKTNKYFDAKGIEFECTISYGYPEKEKDEHVYHSYTDNVPYRFLDNNIYINVNIKNGWLLGEKINENIKRRKRDMIINKLL